MRTSLGRYGRTSLNFTAKPAPSPASSTAALCRRGHEKTCSLQSRYVSRSPSPGAPRLHAGTDASRGAAEVAGSLRAASKQRVGRMQEAGRGVGGVGFGHAALQNLPRFLLCLSPPLPSK